MSGKVQSIRQSIRLDWKHTILHLVDFLVVSGEISSDHIMIQQSHVNSNTRHEGNAVKFCVSTGDLKRAANVLRCCLSKQCSSASYSETPNIDQWHE